MTTLNTIKSKKTFPYEEYDEYFLKVLPTGSRVICPSAVTDESDYDYIFLLSQEQVKPFEDALQADGWVLGGSMIKYAAGAKDLHPEHTYTGNGYSMVNVFHSWKRDDLNFLLTCNEQYFDDFTRATFLARGLNLTEKTDRVMLFEALTRDVWPDPTKVYSRSVEPVGIQSWRGISPGVYDTYYGLNGTGRYAGFDTLTNPNTGVTIPNRMVQINADGTTLVLNDHDAWAASAAMDNTF